MNPVRARGPAVAAGIWTDHWIYWAGPLAGPTIAALVYDSVFTGRLWRRISGTAPATPAPEQRPAAAPAAGNDD